MPATKFKNETVVCSSVRKSYYFGFKKTDLNIDIFSFKKLWDHFFLSLDHSFWFIAKTTQKIAQFRIKRYS